MDRITWKTMPYIFQESIDLLNRSGIQFKRHEEEGIDVHDFTELLIPSGLVLLDCQFVSFHSPYDFGYLLKILTNQNLPDTEEVSCCVETGGSCTLYGVQAWIQCGEGSCSRGWSPKTKPLHPSQIFRLDARLIGCYVLILCDFHKLDFKSVLND